MRLRETPESRRRHVVFSWPRGSLAVGGLLLALIGELPRDAGGQIVVPGIGRAAQGEQDLTAGVYLPTDRTLSRAVTRAKERIGQREYHEALQFLHGLLSREEDWFLDAAAGGSEQLGVKSTARQLIGALPAEGHEAYERLHGATARRQLEAALRSGSRAELGNIVRQFFHTSAGYEATLVLAQAEADQGHRLAAAQLFQELIDTPRAAALFEPQLSVMAALNHLASGNREAAAATMRALAERSASTEIELTGKRLVVPAADSDLVAWLVEAAGEPSITTVEEVNWLTARGGTSRNVQKPGGRPHLRARWQARVVNDPSTEAYLAGRAEDFAQRGVVAFPGARPLAVGDVVIMRTPENLVAVDFQTGKRIWETREEEDYPEGGEMSGFSAAADRGEPWSGQGNPLDERMWDDALVGSISSDGKRVFMLRGVTVAEDEQAMGWRLAPGFGRVNGEVQATTNQLAAYDMATQGKLAWELDGSRSPPPLDGAFFLGAPLAIDKTLYVMAEIRSAIYLFALDAATGQVQWQQQLVNLEQNVGQDVRRRRAGAMPSYDGGILVCPTGASTLIALDVVKRQFAWVYRYPREAVSPAEMRNIWQNQAHATATRTNDRWLDNGAVIGEGHVLLTSAESGELHCIELRTGKLAWKRRRGDSLFVGCVGQGNVLVVGSEGVEALRVADGSTAWEKETVRLPAGSLPAGHGYLSDGLYYFPLTTGAVAAIAMKDGELTIQPSPRPGTELGNLICHRGSILSQSPLVLDKYEQIEVLEQRVEKALAANPEDATALREMAELARLNDESGEALALLKRALAIAPDDALIQEVLAELLLESLAADYGSHREDVALVRRLIHDRGQQIELLRIEASGLEELGQRLAAFDAYLRLADFTAEDPAMLSIASHHRVRSDRWICGRLERLWSEATEEERREMGSRLTARRPSLEKPRTASELRHYLAHFDGLLGAEEVRRALARLLIDRKRLPEAELELLALSGRPDGDSQAVAGLVQRLATATAANELRGAAGGRWPRGRVEGEFAPGAAATGDARPGIRNQPERQSGYRQLRIEQDSSLWPSSMDWLIAMDCTELVGRNALGDDVFQLAVDQSSWVRASRDSNVAHAGRLGRLMFVTLGGQVMAIDAGLAGAGKRGDVLWQTEPFSRYTGESPRVRRVAGEAAPRVNRRPAYHNWSGRRRLASGVGTGIGSLGPVTPRGIVFQEHDQLKCVDPLSGELLWSRTDIPAGCELLGDMEHVFAADVSSRLAHVIRTVDGQLVGKRDLPKQEWLLTVGRNIAEVGFKLDRENRRLSLRISDLLSGDALYDQEFSISSRVSVMEPDAIAVYEPSGKLRVLDVRTGKVSLEQDLEPLAEVDTISTLRTDDKLFVMISAAVDQQFKPLAQQPDFPMVNGYVYAFDRGTGKALWPTPAVVRHRGLVLSLPREIPLLVFADRRVIRDPATGGGAQLRVLCIDQTTGQTVYRNDKLPDTSIVRFRIRGEPGSADSGAAVAVEMNAGKIQLAMTDAPRPPRPPANDDVETQRESDERGLRGIGKRMSGALQGALENPLERQRLRQLQLIEQARRQALKAQEERLRQLQIERAEQQEKDDAKPAPPQTDDD